MALLTDPAVLVLVPTLLVLTLLEPIPERLLPAEEDPAREEDPTTALLPDVAPPEDELPVPASSDEGTLVQARAQTAQQLGRRTRRMAAACHVCAAFARAVSTVLAGSRWRRARQHVRRSR